MDGTLLKGLTILEMIVAESEPVGVTELAQRLELPKSNVHRSVATLREAGYLDFDTDSRRYYPSLKLSQMGRRVGTRFPFRLAVLPALQHLVAETGESAHFTLLDGANVVFVANALPPKDVASVIPDNLALPWNDSALGLALVSALAEEERLRLLGSDTTLTEKVERAAQDGYALIQRHEVRRIFELAAPVRSNWNTVVGAIGITGPAMRFTDKHLTAYIAQVQAAAMRAFDSESSGLSENGKRG